jgi:predicted acetyltransferase
LAQGVGPALHEAFIKKAEEKDIMFIYLYPINDGVSELYKKQPWGYGSFLDENIKHLYRLVKGTKSDVNREVFLRQLRLPNPRRLTVELDRLLTRWKDNKQFNVVRRDVFFGAPGRTRGHPK